jgi:protein SCO1/2
MRRASRQALIGVLVLAASLLAPQAGAVTNPYARPVESVVDASIFKIDEKAFLGVKLPRDVRLVDQEGKSFKLGEKFGKPLVVVLSYYQCDGTCSVVNEELKRLLLKKGRSKIGEDFEVLTLSFDKLDTPETMAAFAKTLDLPETMKAGWTLATFEDKEAIQTFADTVGFKFFWSARDRIFFHPGVYMTLTPEGRVSRYLYALTADAKDIDLALVEALGNQIAAARVIDFAIGLCYSYNFAEGRYTINLPVLIGAGSFLLGITLFAISALYYRRRTHLRGGIT